MLLLDPWAFGAAGAQYALATAGGGNEPAVEREQEETESESGSSENESAESEGRETDAEGQAEDPPLPQELPEVQARQTAEAERLRTKRATRIAIRPTQANELLGSGKRNSSVKISGAPGSLGCNKLYGLGHIAKSDARTLGSSHQTNETERRAGLLKRIGTTTQKTAAYEGKNKRLATELGWRLGV